MNIFADIGNTAMKWCEVEHLPELQVSGPTESTADLSQYFTRIERAGHREAIPVSPAASRCWWISSVNQPAATWLADWLEQSFPEDRVEWISRHHMPIKVEVDEPATVGLDRLLGSVAVNARRDPLASAVYCDFGTATTVNVISDSGAFQGGAILPGIQTQLRSLSQATDRLPDIDWKTEPMPTSWVGKRTRSAILSGVVYGHAFGVTELVRRYVATHGDSVELWITGGGLPNVDIDWPVTPHFVPHLVLEGILHYALSQSNRNESAGRM